MADRPPRTALTPEQERARQEALRALAVLLADEIIGERRDPVVEPEIKVKRRTGFTDHWDRVRAGKAVGRPGINERVPTTLPAIAQTSSAPTASGAAPMTIRPSPSSLMTSTQPLLHCCETWHVLAAGGERVHNRPKEQATWDAIAGMQRELLAPLEAQYGLVTLTYGFAGPELVKAIESRAAEGGWLPNISPRGDQHAGYELNTRGNRICKRDGIAVDLRVPGVSSEEVAEWVIAELPFDRIYLYSAAQPFHIHMSWAPEHLRVGQVVRMVPTTRGGLMPRVVVRGRKIEPS